MGLLLVLALWNVFLTLGFCLPIPKPLMLREEEEEVVEDLDLDFETELKLLDFFGFSVFWSRISGFCLLNYESCLL